MWLYAKTRDTRHAAFQTVMQDGKTSGAHELHEEIAGIDCSRWSCKMIRPSRKDADQPLSSPQPANGVDHCLHILSLADQNLS